MLQPKLPGYDLGKVFAARDRIVAASAVHVGTVLVGEYYEDWLALVQQAMPGVPAKALALSARAFLDRELEEDKLKEFAWRIAGNARTLKAGRAVFAWGMQAAEEWMPLLVTRAQPGRNRKDVPGHWITFLVLAGTACPMAVRRFWTRPQSSFVAGELGFNRKAERQFSSARGFVGMLLYGLFEPKLSEDKPRFHRVHVTDTMRTHNVAMIEGRKAKPCPTAPFHFTHPCEACTIGQDRCQLAVHPRTFVSGRCADCGEPDAMIDPDQPERCVECSSGHRPKAKEQ